MRKLKLLFAALALLVGGVGSASAQASYNHTYTEGVTVAAGGDYFLYNIASKMFLNDGMDYGTHASIDHAGRVVTLATSGSGYTIATTPFSANGSDLKAGSLNLNGSGQPYVDMGSSAEWTFESVSVDGYTNAYAIKTGDKYLYIEYTDGLYQSKMGAFVRAGNSTGDTKSYWLLIPMSVRQVVKDYTYLLRNTDFNHPWELPIWTNAAGWTNLAGGKKENACAEMYGKGFDIYQTISATVDNGRYKLYNQAFYNNNDAGNQTYLYANSNESAIAILNANGEGTDANMAGASDAFTAGQYVNSVETFVSNGSLKVGIKNATTSGSAWTIMDNFYLEYLGQCVMDYAIALPDGGAMAADTWYYFDIALARDDYAATATTLGDIICTSDGYTQTSAAAGNVTLTASDNNLAVGRYYVKSSSAQNLVIASPLVYQLGSVTAQSIADGGYVKSLSTLVLTYGDAATTDGSASLAVIGTPTASLKKNGSEIATGTLTADNSAKTLTATFSDVDLVINSNDYSIVIPAGAFGYEGQATNAEVTVNFNTPLFADGDYYLKNKDNGAYFAGGNVWGTQAITNNIGHKVGLTALPNGKYQINTYLFNNASSHYLNGLWCDGAEAEWTFEADGGNYVISNADGKLTAGSVGETMTLANGTGDNTKWTMLSEAEWKEENVTRLDAANADNGVDATFYLPAANFNRNDNNENAKWQGSPGIDGLGDATCNFNGQKYSTTPFDVYQELNGLKPGVYKVTMQGFYRNATTDDRNAILYANDCSIAIVNIRSANIVAKDDDKGFTTANGDYYVPNTQAEAAKAFNNNYYNHELSFTVGPDGKLRIGVKKTTGSSGDWAVFDNFKLTYYGVLDYTALQTAYDAVVVPTLGFEEGQYAPYTNVSNLQALATAKELLDNKSAINQTEITSAKSAIESLSSWTVNATAMDAVCNGNFASSTPNATSGVDVDMPGWTLVDGIRMVINNTTEYPGLSSASGNAGVFSWGGTALTYGEKAGYTMPLAGHTIYELTAKIAGWKDGDMPTWLSASVLKETEGMASMNILSTSVTKRISETDPFVTCTIKFVTDEAGDYVLSLSPNKNNVLTDISITKAANQYLEFADGSVPSYAPGTYPMVKITRTLTAGKWATAVYPFAVSGVDKIAVLDSYNKSTGALGFTTAAASTANVPFLMRSTADKSEISLNNVKVAAAAATDAVKNEASLKGVYAATTVDNSAKNYVLSNNVIYPIGANSATVNPYRAYIQIAQDADPARGLTFTVDGETTAIDGITAGENAEDGAVYNLQGQRVVKAQKGLYIKDGRKVMVK